MTVILVIHILVSLVLVGVVLMQRSEGGALGVGGGGGGGGLMSGRGAAGAIVRTTIIAGAIFFVTSLLLTTMTARHLGDNRTDVERALDEEFGGDTGQSNIDILNDPTAPLLDDGPSSALPSTEPTLPSETDAEDPLAADIPAATVEDPAASDVEEDQSVEEPQQ
ncbi:preprotein translocase subunit SecG [Henriciella litoralis]|uniref:preprotein translocase subunit SecG n=1 Tax=Henriciella litoralis TaxID=568102 RepID=UPI000A027E6C|nr:preprotein translocase subunit SecG [Henriciella litoralis]